MPSTVLEWMRRPARRRDFAQVPEDWLAVLRRAQEGDPSPARQMLAEYLSRHPDAVLGWFWLACVSDNPWEVLSALRKAEELGGSDMPAVRQGMTWAQERIARGERAVPMQAPFVPALRAPRANGRRYRPVVPVSSSSLRWPLVVGLIAIVLVVALGFGWVLAGNGVLSAEAPASFPDAPSAGKEVPVLRWLAAGAGASRPAENPFSLAEEHAHRAEALLQRGDFRQALSELDAAIALRPYDMQFQEAHALAAQYWTGLQRYHAGDWPGAVQSLETLWHTASGYREVGRFLGQAYFEWGMAEQHAGRLDEAERLYQRAMQLLPESVDIEDKLLEIHRIRNPIPTGWDKKIVVDIASQRFYAYEGERLVYEFVCSTGGASSPTVPGEYQVLDKIPVAYSSAWHLEMPYWLGIYWSGTLENGIHALPILSNGQVLWEGYLGQPVSFGCIILSTEAAKIIYDWAEIGTPVIIR
jgi:tetratricopeptide (TPR) repeat protein